MFTDTLPLIAPHLLEILKLLITLLIGWITKRLRDWTASRSKPVIARRCIPR